MLKLGNAHASRGRRRGIASNDGQCPAPAWLPCQSPRGFQRVRAHEFAGLCRHAAACGESFQPPGQVSLQLAVDRAVRLEHHGRCARGVADRIPRRPRRHPDRQHLHGGRSLRSGTPVVQFSITYEKPIPVCRASGFVPVFRLLRQRANPRLLFPAPIHHGA